jgi:predicted RNA-binding protein YlxR (DUF448 family)
VGCRARAGKATLLRVVAIGGVLTPDLLHRLPGRGACVHPDPGCVDLAERRRAFPRALRLPGPLDVTPVRECVAALLAAQQDSPTEEHTPLDESRSTSS